MNAALIAVESAIEHELRHDDRAVPVRLVLGSGAPKKWRKTPPLGGINCFTSKHGFVIPMERSRNACTRLEWSTGMRTLFTTI